MDINLPMSPPVNNSMEESVYDKLDAMAFEKTRVMNCQLDMRLSIQERTLNKYRRDVERVHVNQSKRLQREFKKINEKKPDYVYDDTDLVMAKSRESQVHEGRQRSQSECSGIDKGGHCKRYYAHHYQVKYKTEDKKKEDKKKSCEKPDFFNLKLKMFFYNTMRNVYATQQRIKEDDDEDNRKERNTHNLITLPGIPLQETNEIREDTNEHIEDDVFRSPRQHELAIEQEDTVHDELQNSTNSLWSKSTVSNEISPKNEKHHHRKRASRTLRMFGTDNVLSHVNKKRESLDEKEFAKMREQWLQNRQSSEKMFAAIH